MPTNLTIDWNTAAEISQVIITIITAIGVVISLFIGRRTLLALKEERLQSVRPYLSFDLGAQGIPIEQVNADGVPGLNFSAITKYVKHRPPGENRLSAKASWGHLRNHGNGSALNSRVTFIPVCVFIGNESFSIGDDKRTEFPYSVDVNTIPAHTSHIVPGGEGSFFRLPTPIVVDYERKIRRIDCIIRIEYNDIYGNNFISFQGVRVWVKLERSLVVFTFLEEMRTMEDHLPSDLEQLYTP